MLTLSDPTHPRALVIEDHAPQAELAQRHLKTVGFEVVVVKNLVRASEEARRMLDPRQEYRPTLILVDCKGVQPGRPDVEGTNWVAVIVQAMQNGLLHPAVIVAISGDLTKERALEARAAGCHEEVLEKPLTADHALWLRSLMMQPPQVPHVNASPEEQRLIQAFQTTSARSLHAIVEPSLIWTVDDVYLLLRHLTAYPLQPEESPRDHERTEELLHSVGGTASARELLRNVASQLAANGVFGEILAQFLAGRRRPEIVKYFVSQDLYDDSHIYNSIKELPARIYERLKTFPHIG